MDERVTPFPSCLSAICFHAFANNVGRLFRQLGTLKFGFSLAFRQISQIKYVTFNKFFHNERNRLEIYHV